MTSALLCVLLRLAVPVTLGQAEFIANDPALRWGTHVRLSPAAAHYLRTETWEPAHPQSVPNPEPRRRATKHRRSKR